MVARYGKIVDHEPAGIVIQTRNAVSKSKVGGSGDRKPHARLWSLPILLRRINCPLPTGKGTALADVGANTNVLKLLENACLEFPENISLKTVLLSRVTERLHTMWFKNCGILRFVTQLSLSWVQWDDQLC